MLKYRLNPMNIDSIAEFGRIRGGRAGANRNTYMVKFVGANVNTVKEINELRKYLTVEMNEGRIYYKYMDSLCIKSDYTALKETYESFINTGHIDLDIVRQRKITESELTDAINEMQKLLQKYKKNITDTIKKNIMVKLLYWLEENFSDIKIDRGKNIKIVAENIQKESEIYFFVFLNLLGMDICLLQYSKDISIMDDYYYTKRLGDFYEGKMVYEPVETLIHDNGREDSKKKKTTSVGSGVNTEIITRPKSTQLPKTSVKTYRELSYVELARLSTSIVMIAIFDSRKKIIGTGSGIMIGKDGFILTNNHVIKGGYYFEVRIEDDERIYETYEVIKYNQHLDLAVIRIPRVLSPLRLYDGREQLVRGQKVVAIGSPLGLFNSVSDGIISGFRNIDDVDMIQFSAPISPGSSGGAVLNMYGEVIGISTAGFSKGQNINLAVPYDALYNFTKSFMK